MVEVIVQMCKERFMDNPSVPKDLDLVKEDDQFTLNGRSVRIFPSISSLYRSTRKTRHNHMQIPHPGCCLPDAEFLEESCYCPR